MLVEAAATSQVHSAVELTQTTWKWKVKAFMSHMATVWKTKPCCAPPAAWSLKHRTEPIVVGWLLAVCFSGSLIRRRKTEWAPRTEALLDHRLQDRITWFPLLHWELLHPLRKTAAPSQDYYFWQCLPQEGTFADLMGPGPLYTAFCMAPGHHFHREGKKELRDVFIKSKQDCPRLCDPQHRHTLNSLWGADELKWFLIRLHCPAGIGFVCFAWNMNVFVFWAVQCNYMTNIYGVPLVHLCSTDSGGTYSVLLSQSSNTTK